MEHLLEFSHSENSNYLLNVKLQMLQALLVVDFSPKLYTVYIVLFHKNGGEIVAVTNCMSHVSMLIPTKATVKLDHGNMKHSQVIGIILCCFPNCPIIYVAGSFYYLPGHSSNKISSGDLNCFVGSPKVTSKPLGHCNFVDAQGCSWRLPYQNENNIDYLQIEIFRVNTHINRNIVVTAVCAFIRTEYL